MKKFLFVSKSVADSFADDVLGLRFGCRGDDDSGTSRFRICFFDSFAAGLCIRSNHVPYYFRFVSSRIG